MRYRRFPLDVAALVLLIIAAFASAAFALRPLIYRAEKTQKIQRENQQFYETVQQVQQKEKIPYERLRTAMEQHNKWLFDVKQGNLTSPQSYEEPLFLLTDYGLPDEVFGVIRIPAMEVEMPIYLGANEENMANGAAVLSQTSIPIGGDNTNSVIAGHRGYSGYKYFMDIEALQEGEKVYITNLWEELVYEVKDVKIVYPDDVDSVLIQPGKDMITLMTCHPYASGGKYRYLVYCERTEETGQSA